MIALWSSPQALEGLPFGSCPLLEFILKLVTKNVAPLLDLDFMSQNVEVFGGSATVSLTGCKCLRRSQG